MNIRKSAKFSDMVVAFTLPVEDVEDNVPSTFREAELSSESELWRHALVEEIESLHINDTWKFLSCPNERRQLVANESLQKKDLKILLCVTRPN